MIPISQLVKHIFEQEPSNKIDSFVYNARFLHYVFDDVAHMFDCHTRVDLKSSYNSFYNLKRDRVCPMIQIKPLDAYKMNTGNRPLYRTDSLAQMVGIYLHEIGHHIHFHPLGSRAETLMSRYAVSSQNQVWKFCEFVADMYAYMYLDNIDSLSVYKTWATECNSKDFSLYEDVDCESVHTKLRDFVQNHDTINYSPYYLNWNSLYKLCDEFKEPIEKRAELYTNWRKNDLTVAVPVSIGSLPLFKNQSF